MADKKTLKDKIRQTDQLGLELLRIERMTGTHVKLHYQYKGECFFLTTSSAKTGDPRVLKNFTNDARLAKRAIDTGDVALSAKYLACRR